MYFLVILISTCEVCVFYTCFRESNVAVWCQTGTDKWAVVVVSVICRLDLVEPLHFLPYGAYCVLSWYVLVAEQLAWNLDVVDSVTEDCLIFDKGGGFPFVGWNDGNSSVDLEFFHGFNWRLCRVWFLWLWFLRYFWYLKTECFLSWLCHSLTTVLELSPKCIITESTH